MADHHKIFFDARCLQDPNYQFRGVGRHASNICTRPEGVNSLLIACCSRNYPSLPPQYAALFDKIQYAQPKGLDASASIVSLSPMTHSEDFITEAGAPLVRSALIYDFIPWDHPGYFSSPENINQYTRQLSALQHCNLLFSISQYSGKRLVEICNKPQEQVIKTAVGVGEAFYQAPLRPVADIEAVCRSHGLHPGQYVVFVGGGDPRKNADLVVRVMAQFVRDTGRPVQLAVCGQYPVVAQSEMARAYLANGGFRGGLLFLPHVSDEDLAALYRGSLANVVASLIEGFSMPVVEGIASGALSVVSDCDAHLELVNTKETIFGRHNVDEALACLKRVADLSSQDRDALQKKQGEGVDYYRPEAVRGRFWAALTPEITSSMASPVIRKDRTLRIAIATPWPPQKSGVADYTYNCVEYLSKKAEVDIYSNVDPGKARFLPGVRILPLEERINQLNYDKTYFVIGNSHFHQPIIDQLITYGGSAIIHDSRLFEYYYCLNGGASPKFLHFASDMIGREVTETDVQGWLQDQRSLPDLFLRDVINASDEVIVHHPGFARELRDRYGIEPKYIPFAVRPLFEQDDLTPARRANCRKALGLSESALTITTFGWLAPSKGIKECVYTLAELEAWNIRAEFHFVGTVDYGYKKQILEEAEFCGVAGSLRFFDDYVSDSTYRDYLLASDIGVQLRKIGFGQGSGAIAECAAAGLFTVANESIAESVEAPAYVCRVPDVLSPTLMAEKILDAVSNDRLTCRLSAERVAYLEKHSFQNYADKLIATLS